jgi:hypothetical protein
MPNVFPLDEIAIQFIERRLVQIRSLESEINGALALVIQQQGLEARGWELDLPNRQLVRKDEGPQQVKVA